jgi:formylglycine-generating enzyme required for sulfatase activity
MLRLRVALLVAGATCPAMLAACGDDATVGANKQPVVRDCAQCPGLVRIEPGAYVMGSPTTERYRGPNEDQVPVTIRYPFLIGRAPVTVGEFAAFVAATAYDIGRRKCNGYTSSGYREVFDWRSPGFPQEISHPVTCVSWRDANAYAAWLSKVTGKSYRLPSEAEFEYAARAGTTTPFWFGHYMPKRIAVMSHGVRLVLSPRRAATIQPDQMLTAARPNSAPRAYSEIVGRDTERLSVK